MSNRNNRCISNVFLILGLVALVLTATYKVFFYASYLNIDKDEVVFDWTGGEQDVWVYTDANSWVVEDEEGVSWATFQNWGGKLHIYAYQNNSKEDRSSWVRIRSGFVEGIGNEDYSLKVVQKGKQATYLNASKQTVSFSERGGSESLQIDTDGDSWYVTDCPGWITQSVYGNTLVLNVSGKIRKSRVGVVRLKADDLMAEICVFQYFTNGRSFVDLGLTSGVLWANCNVGAEQPYASGDYFAWGETKPKDFYGGNYSYCGKGNILSLSDDAASVNWGGDWRMPTENEVEELVNECNWEWHSNGYRVIGPNGNSIFLPAAGWYLNDELHSVGIYGGYWTSSLYHLEPYLYAYELSFFSDENPKDSYRRANYRKDRYSVTGLTIRPVMGNIR